MILLAVDTATQCCSVAIVDETSVISEYSLLHKNTHSKFVMGMIHEVLIACGLKTADLDGLAVTIGPGSFTGLRIGLSTVKALSLATGKPLAGVSSLEALAYQLHGTQSLICPMLDARRREVYTARYRYQNTRLICDSPPKVVRPEKAVADIHAPCMMVGDGAVAYREMIKKQLGDLALFAHPSQHFIRASAVGHLAIHRFLTGSADDPALLTPVYLRKSDAEKNLKPDMSLQIKDNPL